MTTTTPLSRRALLAISAAAAAGTATAGALPALAEVNPDAQLLRLGREHDGAYARVTAANRQPENYDEDDFEALCEAYTDLEFKIQNIPAQTWAGVVVKARIAAEYAERCSEGRILDDILPSLVEDILRIANVPGKRDTARAPAEEGSEHGAV